MHAKVLWLADNRIAALGGLERLASLRELNLAQNPLGNPGERGWAGGLAPCAAHLTHLNLAATRMHSFLQACMPPDLQQTIISRLHQPNGKP